MIKHLLVVLLIAFAAYTFTAESRAAAPKTSSTIECTVCEWAINYIKTQASQNDTKNKIEDDLLKLCSDLPSSLQSDCQTGLKTYFPTLYSLFLNYLSATKICTDLELCK
uniref:Prosaposin n=1 Tax=Hofstenia miamia TaxID=442651 RepID=A0A8K1Z270_HOFMI|nr:prosaposin [Hofstenia miamia]